MKAVLPGDATAASLGFLPLFAQRPEVIFVTIIVVGVVIAAFVHAVSPIADREELPPVRGRSDTPN